MNTALSGQIMGVCRQSKIKEGRCPSICRAEIPTKASAAKQAAMTWDRHRKQLLAEQTPFLRVNITLNTVCQFRSTSGKGKKREKKKSHGYKHSGSV